LYEIANIYIPKELPLKELPNERKQFTLGMYGEGNFYDLKGIVEVFIEKIGLKKKISYNPNTDKPFLHPGRKAEMVYAGKVIGYLGEVHPEVTEKYEIGTRTYVAVLDMPEIIPYANFDVKYEGIARYPAISRDISMTMKKDILAGDVEEVIQEKGGRLLESYHLFDVYEGEQIEEGFKSMAYSIVFRDKDKTLKDEEVNTLMEKILKGLGKLGIELRQQ
ncbi:MAG TPA: phenylalanine--tRNA ligase subunit beta, partial [Clostridiales bacterium]|nr:phenylalanine--tRNA ligase subunit beta [Clostridiales bacterium]